MTTTQTTSPLTIEAFRSYRWRAAASRVKQQHSGSYFEAFLAMAAEAEEAGQSDEARVLSLLARASSLMLQPGSVNEPFGPLAVIEGRRTPIVDDLSSDEIDFLARVVGDVDDAWLQARLADLVWVVNRDHEAARTAIDAYGHIPIRPEDPAWKECWERAIRLARLLRDRDRLETIECDLLDKLDQAEPGMAHALSELLLETGLAQDSARHIAQTLRDAGVATADAGNPVFAIECFKASAAWFKQTKDQAAEASARARVGDLWMQQAQAHLSSEQPSHMNARSATENALKAYRRVANENREDLGIDVKIEEVRALLEQAGTGSLGEMGVISSSKIDISDEVAKARRRVRGKSLPDALEAFANLYQGASLRSLLANAKEALAAFPIQGLLSAMHVAADGRVVGKTSSAGDQDGYSWAPDGATRRQVLRDYNIEVGYAVQAAVWPALQQLNLEHRITERELLAVAVASPLVPPNRERLFAKGLAAGFDRDFATALHLLVPQVEHLVRFHLRQRGVFTTTVRDGIEMEVGLSKLLEKPEVQDIFGKDHTFELQALFTDPIGSNFRNDVAHGLLDYDAAMSLSSAYAWWWCLRLVYLTYRQAVARAEGTSNTHNAGTDDERTASEDDPSPREGVPE